MEKVDDAGDFKELISVCRYMGLEPGQAGLPEIRRITISNQKGFAFLQI
jgi:hypothetical protein